MKNILYLSLISLLFSQCKNSTEKETTNLTAIAEVTTKVNPSFFLEENLTEPITKQEVTLDDGSKKMFYKITIKPQPKEHETGPWCPKTITDSKDNGGVWFKDGHLYDVNGYFIAHLDEFYSDPKWKVYHENGNIKITETQEACEGAAKPDVEEEYQNHCVECLPSYYPNVQNTFLIPVEPAYIEKPTRISRGGVGVAFNGVKFDGPAPTHAIIAAHTIAPLDDCGGHVNPHAGYHYHAVTGCSKQIEQKDDHSSLIGYAMDGFGIYSLLNKKEIEASNLDECGGHKDANIGYHYHAGKAGDNQILKCLHGQTSPEPRRPPRH